MIALLTALVSVVFTGIPSLKKTLTADDSASEVQFTGDDHSGGILLTGFNSGDRPAGISSITLRIPFKANPLTFQGVYDARVGDGDGFIFPTTTGKKMRVMFPDVKFDQKKYILKDLLGNCVFEIEIREFSGKERPFKIDRPCRELSVSGIIQ